MPSNLLDYEAKTLVTIVDGLASAHWIIPKGLEGFYDNSPEDEVDLTYAAANFEYPGAHIRNYLIAKADYHLKRADYLFKSLGCVVDYENATGTLLSPVITGISALSPVLPGQAANKRVANKPIITNNFNFIFFSCAKSGQSACGYIYCYYNILFLNQ